MIAEPSRRACEVVLWFILFFAPAAFGATEWWSRAVLECLIFVLASMCMLRSDFAAALRGPLIGFAAILVLGAVQLTQARLMSDPGTSLPFTLSRPQTLYAMLHWAAMAALLWVSSGIFRWEGSIRRAFAAIFVTGLFIGVVGIIQRGHSNLYYYGLRPVLYGLAFGPFANYNHAAAWMVVSTCIGGGLLVAIFERAGRVPLSDRIAKGALIAFCLAILLAAIIETGSRGAIYSLFISMLFTIILSLRPLDAKGGRRILLAMAVLCSGAAVGLYLAGSRWLGLVGGKLDESVIYRLSMYRSGLSMFLDFPITGVGLGSFTNAGHAYRESIIPGVMDHVHSSWMEIALESGALGLAVFLITAVAWPLAALGRRIVGRNGPGHALAMGCFAALLAFTLQGIVEFSFQIPALSMVFAVLLGATTAMLGIEVKPLSVRSGGARIFLTASFAALALISLPPGISGSGPRLTAPFGASSDTLLPASDDPGNLNRERERLLLNPTDPRLRHRYGGALWSAGRRQDAAQYLNDPGQLK